MKKQLAVKTLLKAFNAEDLVFIIGDTLYEEAIKNLKNNIFYLPKIEYMLSFILGVSLATDKKVYILCEDEFFINNLSEAMQISASKAKNIFLFLFNYGEYTSVINAPTVFESINSKHGLFYNLGFLVHDYTKHLSFANSSKEISNILDKTRGPLVVILKLENPNKCLSLNIDYKSEITKLKILLSNKEE